MAFTEEEEFEFALAYEKDKGNLFPTEKKKIDPVISGGRLKQFGRGVAKGATFDIYGGTGAEGSVFEPNPYYRKAGEFVGASIPLILSELTGGTASLLAAGKYLKPLSKLGKSAVEAIGTGVTFEASKGAAIQRPITETLKEIPKTASIFSGFAAAGQGLGYIRKLFGKDLAKELTSHFINTENKLAESLFEKGKPSLEQQFLEKTTFSGFKNRTKVFRLAQDELGKIENRIRGKLEEHIEILQKPLRPETKTSGVPLLEYKPAQTITPTETAAESRKVLGLKFREPKVGTIPSPSDVGEFGSVTAGRPFIKNKGRGEFISSTPEELFRERIKHNEAFRLAAKNYGLKKIPEYDIRYPREGLIETSEIVKVFDEAGARLKTGTHPVELKELQKLKVNFTQEYPKHLTIPEAMGLKRRLDKNVQKAYLASVGTKLPMHTELDEMLANKLREKIYSIDKELGDYAARESLLLRIMTGLKPVAARKAKLSHSLYSTIYSGLFGSPSSNLAAKVLHEGLGKSKPKTSRISRTAARLGVVSDVNTPAFTSPEEAESANLPKGTRITILGRPAIIE